MKNLRLFVFLSLLLSIATASSQIRYANDKITINSNMIDTTSYNLLAYQWNGSYYSLGDKFLKTDLRPVHPCIAGTQGQVLFFDTEAQRYNSIVVGRLLNYSDARAKDSISTLTTGLSDLLRLRPVSYKWKRNGAEQHSAHIVSEVERETDPATAYGPDDNSTQYGFLAQEVEEVIPDAVITDEEGRKTIDYIAMIPMLVQSVQELQTTVEAQAQVIERLTNGKPFASMESTSDNKIVSCAPNPASGLVTISTRLESGVTSASLIICSLIGDRKMSIEVSSSSPDVTEDISTLRSGIYVVTLLVDGKPADSARLVKE